MNDTKTLLTRGGNSMLMIDAANHDAVVALPPDNGATAQRLCAARSRTIRDEGAEQQRRGQWFDMRRRARVK
jgi:hypothetical protein